MNWLWERKRLRVLTARIHAHRSSWMAVGFVRVWRAVEPNHPKAYLYREMMVSGHVGSPFADPRGAMKARIARGLKLGLSEQHAEQLARLRQPEDVQDFVNALPMNFENGGCSAGSGPTASKVRSWRPVP
jgi:hypothetical protein